MSKREAIDKLKMGTVVRHNDDGRERSVVLPPDDAKTTGRFGVSGDRQGSRHQQPKKWSIVSQSKSTNAVKMKEEPDQLPEPNQTPVNAPTVPVPNVGTTPHVDDYFGPSDSVIKPGTMTKKQERRLHKLFATQREQLIKMKVKFRTTYDAAVHQLEVRHRSEVTALKQQFEMETNSRKSLLALHKEQMSELTEEYQKKVEQLQQRQQDEVQTFEKETEMEVQDDF
tara:strand:- start:7561 stop:8238 length:678 start_codon:yes stop_codon:yes gene_type:complete